MPWFLQSAIEHGLTILNWYENLPKNEVPPEHLWEDSEGLDLWWKTVEAKREDGTSSAGSSEDETPELVDNDLAREFKRMNDD